MEPKTERDPRADFLRVYNRSVNRREGAAAMLYWLDSKTDFFTAPASRKHHLAQPGGLVIHSLNVYSRLADITRREMGAAVLDDTTKETVASEV